MPRTAKLIAKLETAKLVILPVLRVGESVPSHTLSRLCAWTALGNFCIYLFYFSDCRFENQAVYADYITLYDNSRQTISTTIAVFRKYVLTSRVFDHQDWSNIYNYWVSRPGCAARARTLFRKGEYVKSDAAPMRRLS